jgi:hypothetical protein
VSEGHGGKVTMYTDGVKWDESRELEERIGAVRGWDERGGRGVKMGGDG